MFWMAATGRDLCGAGRWVLVWSSTWSGGRWLLPWEIEAFGEVIVDDIGRRPSASGAGGSIDGRTSRVIVLRDVSDQAEGS